MKCVAAFALVIIVTLDTYCEAFAKEKANETKITQKLSSNEATEWIALGKHERGIHGNRYLKGQKGKGSGKGGKGGKGKAKVGKGGKGKGQGKGQGNGQGKDQGKGKNSMWGGDKGKGKGWDFGKGKDKDKGKGKGKKGPRRPSGPNLERTRITEKAVTGEVVEWKGKFGFIKPTVDVEHEKARPQHQGKLYVSMSDLKDGVTELTVGNVCQFHIFFDSSGLGAEEVVGS